MSTKPYYADGSPRHIAVYGQIKSDCADYITVVFTKKSDRGRQTYLSMNDCPFSPQGFCEHGETYTGKRGGFGKRFSFYDLNDDCKRAVMNDYIDMWGVCEKGANTTNTAIDALRFCCHHVLYTHLTRYFIFPPNKHYALVCLADKHMAHKFYKSREDAIKVIVKRDTPQHLSEFWLYSAMSGVIEGFYAGESAGTHMATLHQASY